MIAKIASTSINLTYLLISITQTLAEKCSNVDNNHVNNSINDHNNYNILSMIIVMMKTTTSKT